MDAVRRVVIGFGSNLGDRRRMLRAARDALRADPDLAIVRSSPVYESAPAGGPAQGPYLNAAVLLETSLPVRAVLERALAIERSLGRIRPDPERWGPRTIDLDVLWVEGETIAEPDLQVPHPRLKERTFALRPLLDVVPDAKDPRTGEPLAALAAARAPIARVEGECWSGSGETAF